MKSIYVFLTGLACTYTLQAQTTAQTSINKEPAVLSGKVDRWIGKGYLLAPTGYHVYDTIKAIKPDGTFRYERHCQEPEVMTLYLEYLEGNKMKIPVYVANGKETHIEVTLKESSLFQGTLEAKTVYSGDNQTENNYIQTVKEGRIFFSPDFAPIYQDSQLESFNDYSRRIHDKMNEVRAMLNKSKDTKFIASNMKELEEEEKSLKIRYSWSCTRNEIPADSDKDFVNFMNSLNRNDINHLKDAEEYVEWRLNCTLTEKSYDMEHPEQPILDKLYAYKQYIENQDVVNQLCTKEMTNILAFSNHEKTLTSTFTLYESICTDKDAVEKLRVIYNNLLKLSCGSPAPDFTLNDQQGQTMTFQEVIGHGKIAYVDFWATWCAPCCAEIPYIEKLHEEYKDNPDFHFISVSLDANKNAWLGKLKRDQPQWKQYIIPKESQKEFDKLYNVEGIPRFMVFDKNGNIINIDAPRPSFNNIRAYINELLNEADDIKE